MSRPEFDAEDLGLAEKSLTPVSSSNIAAVGYYRNEMILIVAFNDGSMYAYQGVPWGEYMALRRAESKGSYHAENIRWTYSYEKIG